jgi:hypothetical protein
MALKRINLIALTKEQLVELLVKVGSSTFTRDTLESDISKGAPVNDDGTINLIHYAAWLIRENDE